MKTIGEKMKSILAVIFGLMFGLSASMLAGAGVPVDVVSENPNFFAWIFGIISAAFLWLINKEIKENKENNQKQWNKLDNHECRLTDVEKDQIKLKVEHEMRGRYCTGAETYEQREKRMRH